MNHKLTLAIKKPLFIYPAIVPQRLRNALFYKMNPRTDQYMQKLLSEKFNTVKIIEHTELHEIKCHDKLILIFKDAIGYGWFWTELYLFLTKGTTTLFFINGRGRSGPLTFTKWIRLLIKRALEKFWVLEILFFPIFLVASMLFMTIDLIKAKS